MSWWVSSISWTKVAEAAPSKHGVLVHAGLDAATEALAADPAANVSDLVALVRLATEAGDPACDAVTRGLRRTPVRVEQVLRDAARLRWRIGEPAQLLRILAGVASVCPLPDLLASTIVYEIQARGESGAEHAATSGPIVARSGYVAYPGDTAADESLTLSSGGPLVKHRPTVECNRTPAARVFKRPPGQNDR